MSRIRIDTSGAGLERGIRISAVHVVLLAGSYRREILRLIALTAAAFGSTVPRIKARSRRGVLAEYALFTRLQAEALLDSSSDAKAVQETLFETAFHLGSSYRRRLHVHNFTEAMAAARLLYWGLGIDLRCTKGGKVEIHRCSFASKYSPRVCSLISALDRGLIAGLTKGGDLRFRERITEGAETCRGFITSGIDEYS